MNKKPTIVPEFSVERGLIYSEEVQEIMGHVPNAVVRSGVTVIFSIFMLILAGSYFIKVSNVVSAPVILTTLNAPAPLISHADGKIDTWFVRNGQYVSAGAFIALIENTARLDDINRAEDALQRLTGDWTKDVRNVTIPKDLKMGTLQEAYHRFLKPYNDLFTYLERNEFEQKVATMERIIVLNQEHLAKMNDQWRIKLDKFSITEKLFREDSLFTVENRFGSARRELDFSRQNYLQEKESLIAFSAAMKVTEAALFQMTAELYSLSSAHTTRLDNYISELNEAKSMLEYGIDHWMKMYVIVSPIGGKVTFTEFWSSNQVVNTNDQLATVVPHEKTTIVARAIVPSNGFGKVDVGQKVNIKLAGFPHMEYGTLTGTIKSLSLVQFEKGYLAEIELINGMTSNYSAQLKFVQEMDGSAEIMTGKVRLIYKFIRPLSRLSQLQ